MMPQSLRVFHNRDLVQSRKTLLFLEVLPFLRLDDLLDLRLVMIEVLGQELERLHDIKHSNSGMFVNLFANIFLRDIRQEFGQLQAYSLPLPDQVAIRKRRRRLLHYAPWSLIPERKALR